MPVHLDAAAALPLHPAARAALLAALDDGWADPTRLYGSARRARLLLDGAREAVAEVLGARPDEVRFTSSGTAAIHLGIAGALAGRRRVGAHVVHSAIEHSAVLHALADRDTTSILVDRLGRVSVGAYAAAVRPDTALACLISASHEVGTVQPVEAVADACGDVPLLVDAAQTVGRAPLPSGWSLLTASAHKWGGPAGVGVLAVRTGTRFEEPLPAGPLDLPAVLAAAVGLQAAAAEAAAEDARLRPLVDRIRARVAAEIPDVDVVGDPVERLPHLATFSVLYVEGEALLTALDREGFAVSSGSSCTADSLEPSHVLAAMGALTHGNVRVSLHRGVSEQDVDRFLQVLPRVVADLRSQL
ncbi:MAG: aminotransferase class V-fold PLP-dependent enzyme [Actinobacteria bacterium]|nr:aminotransferase class V-fold PLP-dependent enzyme [Actinomycetota bacterium]